MIDPATVSIPQKYGHATLDSVYGLHLRTTSWRKKLQSWSGSRQIGIGFFEENLPVREGAERHHEPNRYQKMHSTEASSSRYFMIMNLRFWSLPAFHSHKIPDPVMDDHVLGLKPRVIWGSPSILRTFSQWMVIP